MKDLYSSMNQNSEYINQYSSLRCNKTSTLCLKTWSFNFVSFNACKQTIVMKIRNSCDMWTCAQHNRNGMCAQLSLIRLRCSYEEALRPCLPTKHLAKPLFRLGGWPRCRFMIFRWLLDPYGAVYSPCVKDEQVELSEMGFRRFWARRD